MSRLCKSSFIGGISPFSLQKRDEEPKLGLTLTIKKCSLTLSVGEPKKIYA